VNTVEPGRAVSPSSAERARSGCLVLFFSLFFLAGCGFLYLIFVRPVWGIWQARDWEATPCVILSSQVREHDDDDGTTYSVAISYRYQYRGETYRADRYHFYSGSSSGYAGKRAIVDRHPVGSEQTCYVNPADPTQAVIERGLTWDLLWGLLPLIFILIGGGGMLYALGAIRSSRAAHTCPLDWQPQPASASMAVAPMDPSELGLDATRGPVTMKPRESPLGRLIGSLIATIFWNGIVSIFLVQLVRDWQRGNFQLLLALFLTPFVLVGLVLLGVVVYSFLGLFNPRPEVTFEQSTVRLGEAIEMKWQFRGSTGSLRGLKIVLHGIEQATYRRGTTTTTDTATFLETKLLEMHDPLDIASGEVRIEVPAGSMHTFEGPSNKILWSVKLHGEVAWWPDVDAAYPLVVLPQEPSRLSRR
jgi:hypothetical protein